MNVTRIGDIEATFVRDRVAVLRINRPPANYFDVELIQQLIGAVDWALANGAWAGVLASEGRHFCAGANLGSSTVDAEGLYDAASRLFELDLPLVAAVQGSAIGGGLGLALTTDLRVAGVSSRFWANFTRLGLHHGFGLTVTLAEVVGIHRARELLLTGRPVLGPEAAQLGLCDRLVDDAEIETAAVELADEIASVAPLAVRSVRRTMRAGLAERVRSATERELSEQKLLIGSADFREGVRANRERRQPQFAGR